MKLVTSRSSLVYGLLWLAFFNGVAATFVSFYGLQSAQMPDTGLGGLYLVLQQIGHFQFLSWLVAVPLICIATIFPHQRFVSSIAYPVFLCFLIVIYADYVVYQLYRFHLNSMVVNLLFGGAANEILIFESAQIFNMFAVLAIFMVVQWLIFALRRAYQRRQRQNLGRWVFLLVLAIQLGGQGIHAWADAWQKTEVIAQVRYIPWPAPLKMKRFLRRHGWLPDTSVSNTERIQTGGTFNYPLSPMRCADDGRQLNLMVILVDGLRFDMLNESVMPFWSKFATESLRFDNHYSSGNATRFGVFGLFSGLHGHYWFDAVRNRTTSVLIEELRRRQYRFGFFANARLTSPEFDRAVFYQVSDRIPDSTPGSTVVERDYTITEQVRAFVESTSDSPFFSLVFFDAPHAYVYPQEDEIFKPVLKSINYLGLDNESDAVPFKNRYKNAIRFNDRLTAQIIESLRQTEQLGNTIVVLTGDHGQEMNETGTNSWGHNSNFSRFQVQVPMLVFWPGREASTFDHLTSHVDLVPTLMKDWLDCGNAVNEFSNGRSLLDRSPRDYVIAKNWNNHAVIQSDVVHVFTPYGIERYRQDDYRHSGDEFALDSSLQLKVLESLSQFYR